MSENPHNSQSKSPMRDARPRAGLLVTALVALLLVCWAASHAYAQDHGEAPAPPTPEALAASGRMTIGVLSLLLGVAVYYGIQRRRLVNADTHSPEWSKKMNVLSIALALGAAGAFWSISNALSRPQPPVPSGPGGQKSLSMVQWDRRTAS